MLGKDAAKAIGIGMQKNHTLTSLNLAQNEFTSNCMCDFA